MCSKYLLPERRVEFSSSITEAAGWNQKGSYHTSPVASVRAADPSWRGNGAAGEGGTQSWLDGGLRRLVLWSQFPPQGSVIPRVFWGFVEAFWCQRSEAALAERGWAGGARCPTSSLGSFM